MRAKLVIAIGTVLMDYCQVVSEGQQQKTQKMIKIHCQEFEWKL